MYSGDSQLTASCPCQPTFNPVFGVLIPKLSSTVLLLVLLLLLLSETLAQERPEQIYALLLHVENLEQFAIASIRPVLLSMLPVFVAFHTGCGCFGFQNEGCVLSCSRLR